MADSKRFKEGPHRATVPHSFTLLASQIILDHLRSLLCIASIETSLSSSLAMDGKPVSKEVSETFGILWLCRFNSSLMNSRTGLLRSNQPM